MEAVQSSVSDHEAVAVGEVSFQMLSIEDPPYPPCSSRFSELPGDEGASKKLSLQEAADLVQVAVPGDEIKHQTPFSIRGYVFTARSKDIGVNWPFSQHLLQFCLKHGVKDLLPPFEHPHLVRAQPCREGLGSNQLIALLDSEETSQEVDLVEEDNGGLSNLEDVFSKSALESSDCAQPPLSEVNILTAEGEDEKGRISKQLFSDEVCEETAPEASLEREAIQPPQASYTTEGLCEASGKKRRLIVKFGGQHNSVRAEENVLNSSTVIESMTSKVCPVCKTFTSTSNTTLNAHIDRCLAADSSSKWFVSKLTKQKVKPRKKKLIADIYLTAARCTLEDLERRNCMNWAADSNFPIQNGEVHTENRRQLMIQDDCNDDGEGSVLYDNSNGVKLRTSSKLNDAAVLTSVENHKPRRNMKDSKDKSFLISKEKHFSLTASKYLNVQPRSKKLCHIMLPKGEIHKARDGKYHVEKNHEKEEHLPQLLKAQDSLRGSRSGTLRQWVCSKRMRLLRKLNDRSSHQDAHVDPLPVAQKPLIQRSRSASGNSSVRRDHIHKLSRFSVNPDTSPNIQSKTGMVMDDKVYSPQPTKSNSNRLIEGPSFLGHDHNENFSRSLENNISKRSKRVEMDTSNAKESPKLSESFPFLPKAKKRVAFENTLSGKSSPSVKVNKCDENSKHPLRKKCGKLTFKKSPRGRCMTEIRDQVVELTIDEDKGIDRMQCSTENSGPSDNIMLLGRYKVLNSGHQRDEAVIASDSPESITSKRFLSSKLDGINLDFDVGGGLHQHISSGVCTSKSTNQNFSAEEVTVSADTGITYSVEKVVRDLCSNIPDGQSGSSYSLVEEHVGSLFATKAWAEQDRPRPRDNQEMHCANGGGEEGTSSHTMAENNLFEGDFSDDQYMGCGTESMHIQEPDGGLEALLEKLLVTSSGAEFIEYQQVLLNGNPPESPISAVSTISSPSMGFSSFRYSEMESLDNSTKPSLVDAINFGPSSALPSVERTEAEMGNAEVKISPGKKLAKMSDYEPCCCLQKVNGNWGTSPIYQESAKLVQMTSNQNISPEIYDSFMTSQSLRTDENVDTTSRILTGPICIKESLDDEVKSLNCSNLGFAGPSSMTQLTSSPILRLMGQNVMIASNEEEAVQPLRVPLGSAENNIANGSNVVRAGFRVVNSSGQDTNSQNSNAEFSNSFRSCSNSKMSLTPQQLPCNHQDHLRMGGFMFPGFAAVKRQKQFAQPQEEIN